jgi:hypothetical protein
MSAIGPLTVGGGRAWDRRRAGRRARVAGVAIACIAIAGLGSLAAPGVMAQPSTVPTGDAAVIRDALDALTTHGSYRYDWRERGGDLAAERRTTGIVIDGDPFRSYRETAVKGAIGLREVQVGGEAWRSVHGSGFVATEPGPDPHPGMLGAWAATLLDLADAGVELSDPVAATVDGRPARYYQGRTIPADAAPSPRFGGAAREAFIDLWVADDGTLLESRIAGTVTDAGLSAETAATVGFSESVRIGGLDDPANAVEAPDLSPLASPDPGPIDPALEAVVLAALDGLAGTRWRGEVNSLSLGVQNAVDVTYVPGEPPSAEAWLSFRDRPQLGFLAIGDDVWGRVAGSPDWVREGPPSAPCFRRPCDAATMADLGWRVREAAGTFRDLRSSEWIDGVKVRHLRSVAGSTGPTGPIPGRLDLWLSEETGLPVWIDFHGLGLEEEVSFSDIGDPSIAIETP